MAKAKESNKQLIGHLMNAISYMKRDKTIEGLPLVYTVEFLQGYLDSLVLNQIDMKNDYFDVAESERTNIN